MIDRNQILNDFQTFFVSREISISPIIADILDFCETIIKKNLRGLNYSISISYGKRILINSKDSILSKISQEDILEIVEYDPIKNIVLVIGKKYPSSDTPIHWIIQKARDDINAIVKISNKKLYDICINKFPIIEDINHHSDIEKSKSILKKLQVTKNLCIKDNEVLLTGFQLKEIKDLLISIFEVLK